MVTFTVRIGVPRQDGTRNVGIKVTANRTNTTVGTSMYVTSKQLSRSGKLRDQRIIDACEDIMRGFRSAVAELGSIADTMTAREVVDYIKKYEQPNGVFRLNFVEWMRQLADSKSASTGHNYRVAATSLERYFGAHTLDINELTSQVLTLYEKWLRQEGIAPGTIVQYMTLIKSAHNAARYKYNDEDASIVRIVRTPFSKYKIPQAPAPQPRGVDLTTLQAIADLPDEERHNARRNIARDLFMLSFGLGGMNVADMYDMPHDALKGDVIEYCRHKTRDARADNALYRVKVLPEVRPLLDRWIDPTKKRLFRLHLRYKDAETCGVALGLAMRAVEEAVPFERHYTFYAARHTYATLAYNVAGLDMYAVNELLNHSDVSMKITARYVERDWQRLYDAHAKIVKLVDWSPFN